MKLEENVMAILSGLHITPTGGIRIVDKLDRGTYLKVNKALEAIGFAWQRKAGAHVLQTTSDNPHAEAIAKLDRVFATGEVTTNAELGFFETPPVFGELVVKMADIRAEHSVLEPSAGRGALYVHIINAKHDPDAPMRYGGYGPAFVGLVERDGDRREYLKRTKRACDEVVDCDDFMDFEESEPYDRVVMNPPFVKVGKGDHLDHVKHAWLMLVPNGILVAILPRSVEFRQDKRYVAFRDWIHKHDGELTRLPDGAFAPSGTNVATNVLRIKR